MTPGDFLQWRQTCLVSFDIRTNGTIDYVGFDRERHADRYLKPLSEMERLFSRYPEALARTMEIVEQCVTIDGDAVKMEVLVEVQHVLRNDRTSHYLMKNRYDVALARNGMSD